MNKSHHVQLIYIMIVKTGISLNGYEMVVDYNGNCTHSTTQNQNAAKSYGILFSFENEETYIYQISLELKDDGQIEHRYQKYENQINGKILDSIKIPSDFTALLFVEHGSEMKLIIFDLIHGVVLKEEIVSIENTYKMAESNGNYYLTGKDWKGIDLMNLEIFDLYFENDELKLLLQRVNHCVISYGAEQGDELILIGGKYPLFEDPQLTSVKWDPETRSLLELFELDTAVIDPKCNILSGEQVVFIDANSSRWV